MGGQTASPAACTSTCARSTASSGSPPRTR
jgi:hypothetical protein